MTKEEILNNLNTQAEIIVMPANEWLAFRSIADKIEEIVGMEAHGKAAVLRLERLEKLIWAASREYDRSDQ